MGTGLLYLLGMLQGVNVSTACPEAASLTVRNGHAMTRHDERGAIVLFGGADERRVLADLWEWNGQEWVCLSAAGPSARTFPALVYDSARNDLVLFGGNRVLFGAPGDTSTFLDDMWIRDGTSWKQIRVPTPPARAEAAVAYDRDRKRVVLFGGYGYRNGERVRYGDTWEWNGTRWELVNTTGPSPRNGAAMAYDTSRRRVVLFGGNGPSGETWEWDGRSWTRIRSADAEGRFNSAMAYDDARDRMLRFGGWTGGSRVGDTWEYDGVHWRRVAEEGPSPRNHAALAYDENRRVVLLFGGHDGHRVFGDTWEWHGARWVQKARTAPRARIENDH